MSSLKTERNLQTFIASLPKEGGLLALRRKPISRNGDTFSKIEGKFTPVLEQKPNFSSQPLNDLSNLDVSEVKLSQTFTKNLNLKEKADMSQVEAENSSKEFKVPAIKQNDFKAKRKSSIVSRTDVCTRRSIKGTLKKDATENKAISKVTQNYHDTKTSATLSRTFSQNKDPVVLSILDKVKTRRSFFSVRRTKMTQSSRSPKKYSLVPPSSSIQKNTAFSGLNKIDSPGKDLADLELVNHSHQSAKASRENSYDNSEDCRRVLLFSEYHEKNNEDVTQPLPLIDFTTVYQNDDESGSVFVHRFKDDPAPASTSEGALRLSEDAGHSRKGETLCEVSSHRQSGSKRSSRVFGRIPVLKKSSLHVKSGVALKNSHQRNARSSDKTWGHDPIPIRNVKASRVVRPSRGTPQILLTPPSFSSTSHSTPEMSLTSLGSHSLSEVEKVTLDNHKGSVKTSPSAPPNSPSAKKIWLQSHPNDVEPNNLRGQAHETPKDCSPRSKCTFQDASTNTLISNPLFDIPFSEFEGQIELILNKYQTSFQDMKAAFLKKSEMLVKEFEESLQPLESLKREILASFKISQPYQEEKMRSCQSQPYQEEEMRSCQSQPYQEEEMRSCQSQSYQEEEMRSFQSQPYQEEKVRSCQSQPSPEEKMRSCQSQPYQEEKMRSCQSQPYQEEKMISCQSQSYQEEKSQVHDDDEEEDLKGGKSHKKYKFLDTPLPLKSKRILSRRFSHPLSPNSFISPVSVREESFHSAESVSISPFTSLVGNFNRNSILPVTPLSHANYVDLKLSFNRQLNTLFN